MSKLLINFAVLNAKIIVNTYTVATLPFYYLYQRPWQTLRRAKSFGVKTTIDSKGRTIYTRPKPDNLKHPYHKYETLGDIIPVLDRSRKVLGVRDVIQEKLELDANGKPIILDDKELTKVELKKEFSWLTVGEVLDQVDVISRGLDHLGIKKGDNVVIYAENGLDWFYVAFALFRMGATTVTLFSTLADAGIVYGLNQCEAKYVITSETLLPKLNKLSSKLDFAEKIVYIPNRINTDRIKPADLKKAKNSLSLKFKTISLDEVAKIGTPLPELNYPAPHPDDVLLIMYTSGTTGYPKGVMLTNKNIKESLINLLATDEEAGFRVFNSRFASYLPMAHLFGYLINVGLFMADSQVALCSPYTLFNSSPSHVEGQIGDIKLIQPQFFATVPLVLERLLKEVYRKLESRTPISAPIFTYLMDYKIRWTNRGFDTPIVNRLACKKINAEFGGQLDYIIASSAPIHERTQALAQAALNAKVAIAYGATEVTGASHGMHHDDRSLGRTGVPFPSVQCYLDDWADGGYRTSDKPNPRGEIVVGGDTVAAGYYKMPKETEESFYVDENGVRWFRTGDIGEIFSDGTLKIIDRKKDLTKLANGEFISLGKIESGLRNSTYVENICVCTDPYSNDVIALISPNRKALDELAKKLNKSSLSVEELCDDKEVHKTIFNSVKETCAKLNFAKRETPLRIRLVKEEWSQENNLLTAAFKMRRKQVNDYYRDDIKRLFEEINQK